MTKNLSQNIRVGLFFLFGLALLWIVYENFDSTSSEKIRGYTVHAPFSNLLQLKASDEVRLAGVKIGVVSSTRLENNHAVANLTIYHNVKIPADSTATITSAGMLGNNYISIAPGHSEAMLAPNTQIHTKESMDINAVIAKVGDLASHFDEFASAFSGSNEQEGSLFYNLNQLIIQNRASLTNLVHNLDHISQQIKDGEGALGALVYDPKIVENLKTTLTNFAEFSQKLNNDKTSLGRLISDDSLYNHAQHVLNKVDNATNSMSDNGPISAVGAAAGALF